MCDYIGRQLHIDRFGTGLSSNSGGDMLAVEIVCAGSRKAKLDSNLGTTIEYARLEHTTYVPQCLIDTR